MRDRLADEEIARRVAYLPHHVVGRHLRRRERPRGIAPSVEIVGSGEGDGPQCAAVAGIAAIQSRTNLTASACGTLRPSSGIAMPGSVDVMR